MRDSEGEVAYSPDPTPWIADRRYSGTGNHDGIGIGEVAREFGVTKRALRFYEAKGLVVPQRDGPARRYGLKELDRLKALIKAKRLGFTLAEIRSLLASQPDHGEFCISRRQCVEQIRLLERRKREIEAALAELRRAYSSLYMQLATSGDQAAVAGVGSSKPA